MILKSKLTIIYLMILVMTGINENIKEKYLLNTVGFE